ncbi:L-threonylcarbamoyladenylate synthase [Domibacillus enclensis]|uniref:Threonylcarbamoyl-AMP synthase n=1 Tax=Domibacillus enclensis TaxID=1017273 RepID=A0A1N6R9M0_9BACI|nr:L-threonylcarbamoyladenylate synthase [Domibacillus enclensis]OXS78987.1 threonylcarbamoyl-AMP synthase [Domibacillus enclensis]SIQ25497.1 translation factor SUA5 [Domibacillus enclensis]
MKTKHWIVDKFGITNKHYPQIQEAASLLQQGEVVAFPTETVYGLGGQVKMDKAVEKIFQAKGRPSDNPLIVHIADNRDLDELAHSIPAYAYQLMDAFWPGPLTVVVPKKEDVLSDRVTAGLQTVAIRMPNHPAALALIKEAGVPVAAPSANRSGKPSPTTAAHVLEDLNGRIAGVVDAGETGVGLESTVVDCTGPYPVILRPGGITQENIVSIVGQASTDAVLKKEEKAPKSPGMKYTHYAPEAPLYLMEGKPAALQAKVEEWQAEGKKVGVLATEETAEQYHADAIITCGQRSDLESVARKLYTAIRSFNDSQVDVIIAETFSKDGLGEAIMNRLEKAAGHKWITS